MIRPLCYYNISIPRVLFMLTQFVNGARYNVDMLRTLNINNKDWAGPIQMFAMRSQLYRKWPMN